MFKFKTIEELYRLICIYSKYDNTNFALRNSIRGFNNAKDVNLNLLNKQLSSFYNEDFDLDAIIKGVKIGVKREIKKINFNSKTLELNYFIECDLSIYIIDLILTLRLNDLYKTEIEKCCYANLVEENTYITDDRNTKSRIFSHYKVGYNKWLTDAIKIADDEKYDRNNFTVVKTDFKRYFYNIDLNVLDSELTDKLKQDVFYINIKKFIFRICELYTEKLKNLEDVKKSSLLSDISKCTLPLGLFSSKVISNIYSLSFDKNIMKDDNCIYYGRYCDDTIIIYDRNYSEEEQDLLKTKYINEINKINLSIKEEKFKCNILDSQQNLKNYLYNNYVKNIDEYKTNIDDDSTIIERFKRTLINGKLLDKLSAFDNEFESININILLAFFNSFVPVSYFEDDKLTKTIRNRIYEEEELFLNYSFVLNCFGFYNKFYNRTAYSKITLLNHKLLSKLKETLNCYKMECLNDDHIELNKNVKEDINDTYEIMMEYYIKPFEDREEPKHVIKPIDIYEEIIEDIQRGSLKSENEYIDMMISDGIFPHTHIISFVRTIKYHLNSNTQPDFIDYNNNTVKKIKKFTDIKETIELKKESTNSNYNSFTITIPSSFESNYKTIHVMQPNVNLSDSILEYDNKLSDFYNFMKILLSCNIKIKDKEKKIHIVFPELYIDLEWIKLLFSFLKDNDMNCTFGFKNIEYNNKFYNLVFDCASFRSTEYMYKNLFVISRNKNHLSKAEYNYIYKNKKLRINDYFKTNIPTYFRINVDGYTYTTYLCFEITDIVARGLFRDKLDIVFIPMHNKDTSYFNNICYSLSRDLSVYVITSNSSKIGNSLVVQPKKSFESTLVEFKGGINNFVIYSEIPIEELKKFKEEYNVMELIVVEEKEHSRKQVITKYKPLSANPNACISKISIDESDKDCNF